MDPKLLYFLIACIAWAALLFYVFQVRQASDLGAGGKAGFVVITALLLPVLGLALWHQGASSSRLEELGFSAYDGLESSVGIATGTGQEPTWLYTLSSSEQALLDFYRQPEHREGWRLTAETQHSLIFERQALKMMVNASEGQAVFQLIDNGVAASAPQP